MKLTFISTAIITAFTLSGCDKSSLVNTELTAEKPAVIEQTKSADHANLTINELYQQASQALFKLRAPEATMFGLSNDDVGKEFNDQLADFSPKKEAELRQLLAKLSTQISAYKLSEATNTDRDNQQVMAGITQYFAGHKDFVIGYIDVWMGLSPFIVNQINGPLIDIPRIMQNDQAITSEQEALNYIARLDKFDTMIASVEEKLRFDSKQNWLPPKSTVTGALRYLKGFTRAEPKDHIFVTSFTDKLTNITALSEQKKQQLTAQVIEKVSKVVYPAYQSITAATEQLFIGWILRKKQLKTCSEFDLIVIAKPQPTSKAEHE